jgi:hypothetical protein
MLPFQGLFLNPTSDWDRSDLEFLIAPAQSPSCPPRRSVLFPALDMHLNEVFEEISYRLSDSPRPREPEMLELCFPVAICDDSVTFLEALAIPKLEFRFFPALSSEPLSPEWLAELALPNDEAFLRFHFEPALAATFELAPPLARIEEVLSPVAVNGIADKERSAAASCRSEKVLKVEPLRRCLFVNTCHFSSDDITEFASLFPKSDVRAARLESGVLMQMGIELIVVWAMGDTPLSTRELIDWWLKYDRILIVSPLLPPFAPVDKIKWRCIISMGQISSAVLPFLVESDEQNRN